MEAFIRKPTSFFEIWMVITKFHAIKGNIYKKNL
jgi:hypothetical protein